MTQHVRIARPVGDLARSVAAYKEGLGLREIGSFEGHDGFDGVMLEVPGQSFHFELTFCRPHPIPPAPTPEDLIVFYVSEASEWESRCQAVLDAGFVEVEPYNPYWKRKGRTFRDHDGYLVVIHNGAWRAGGS